MIDMNMKRKEIRKTRFTLLLSGLQLMNTVLTYLVIILQVGGQTVSSDSSPRNITSRAEVTMPEYL